MRYFVRVSQQYNPKNKLQAAVLELAQNCDRLTLTEKQVDPFIRNYHDSIAKLNRQFYNCHPVEANVFHPKFELDPDYMISVSNVVTIILHAIKGEVEL